LKTTEHFDSQIRRRRIQREWCERVIRNPIATEQQLNGYTRFWGLIEETGRYLRVVMLEDGETLETAHFDRNFRKRQRR
jgi:hypothetical protein